MATCAFITFGCKVNQYDTQAMREAMLRAGYAEVPHREPADVYVVNTCTVTASADAKSGRAVRRLLREHPAARVIIVGCGVDADAAYIEEFGDRVTTAANASKLDIVGLAADGVADVRETWSGGISEFGGHTRAFVKIQDGCDAGCAYCIVPKVRGRSRLRPADDVLDEIERLAGRGYREVVLTGIHLGRHTGLADIVRRASGVDGLPRLRLSSIEALEVSDELLEAVDTSANACPHFHLPLQSGSNDVLRRMNRPYTAEGFLAVVERIRGEIANAAITTDIIVGFPGESDADFAATLDVARRARFGRVHAFRYSDRAGTPAAAMPDKRGTHIVMPRMETLRRVAGELSLAEHEALVGGCVEVLVEHRRDRETRLLNGLTPGYTRVLFEGDDALMGAIARVRVREAGADHVVGALEVR